MSPPPSLGPGGSGSSGEEAPNYLQRLGIPASRFALSTGCAPVELYVFVGGDTAEEIGLTEERVRTVAENLLRLSQLYGGPAEPPLGEGGKDRYPGPPVLEVEIFVLTSVPPSVWKNRRFAFHVMLSFWKEFHDPVSDTSFMATAWVDHRMGTDIGDTADSITHEFFFLLDFFIKEYLRVNGGKGI